MPELLNSNDIFWTQFEPKIRNRFILGIDGVPAYVLRKCDRPKLNSEKKTIDYINLQRFYKGKSTWQDITAILYDPVVPSAAQAIMEWIRLSHESISGRDGYLDFYRKDLTLNILGPVGDKVEEWRVVNAWIQNADFGDVDWTNTGDPCEITIIIAYDYAILQY